MQFAATNDLDFGIAASLVAKHVDAVDLNCGCPQRWAIQEGIGSALLDRDPQVVFDMVRAAKRNTTLDTPITIKIRLLPESMARGSPGNLRKTIDYALQMEKSGISWIAVHGRTRRQTSDAPVDYEAIKAVS
jgi:tRNA-dihydrouridine synthase 4